MSLSRLTAIIMPHHAVGSTLRSREIKVVTTDAAKIKDLASSLRTWTPIKILKYGLEKQLYKKKGWLVNMLRREGILDESKQSLKARIWSDYKAQLLYMDAMKEVLHDEALDPRRTGHVKSKKDGKFTSTRKGAFIPKNPLTALYLCYAYDVPYATFKRWKAESFVHTPYVPDNKGKSVIVNKKWAASIFNAKRMYLDTQMAIWMSQLSTRKYDKEGKKVCDELYIENCKHES